MSQGAPTVTRERFIAWHLDTAVLPSTIRTGTHRKAHDRSAGFRQFGRMLGLVPKNIILCVDDEAIILRSCTVTLAQAGFRTVVAENGAAGLQAFIEVRDEICLVIADVIMPIVNGIEMAESILHLAPETKILLMSGYGDEVIEQQGRNRFPFIKKPFIFRALVDKVQSVLDSNSDAASAT